MSDRVALVRAGRIARNRGGLATSRKSDLLETTAERIAGRRMRTLAYASTSRAR